MPKSKVLILGVSGNSGSKLKCELLSRGYEVKGFTRDSTKVEPESNLTVLQGDLMTMTVDDFTQLFAGSDIVINAFSPPMNDVQQLVTLVERCLPAVKNAGVHRFIQVGGAGGLYVGPGQLAINQTWFPESLRPIAQAHMDVVDLLKGSDINWTVLTPPAYFASGERTGKYRKDYEKMVTDDRSEAKISFDDYAIALADEIETPTHEHMRFTVGY